MLRNPRLIGDLTQKVLNEYFPTSRHQMIVNELRLSLVDCSYGQVVEENRSRPVADGPGEPDKDGESAVCGDNITLGKTNIYKYTFTTPEATELLHARPDTVNFWIRNRNLRVDRSGVILRQELVRLIIERELQNPFAFVSSSPSPKHMDQLREIDLKKSSFSFEEVAKISGLNSDDVWFWVRNGNIRKSDQGVTIARDELEMFLVKHGLPSPFTPKVPTPHAIPTTTSRSNTSSISDELLANMELSPAQTRLMSFLLENDHTTRDTSIFIETLATRMAIRTHHLMRSLNYLKPNGWVKVEGNRVWVTIDLKKAPTASSDSNGE